MMTVMTNNILKSIQWSLVCLTDGRSFVSRYIGKFQ